MKFNNYEIETIGSECTKSISNRKYNNLVVVDLRRHILFN